MPSLPDITEQPTGMQLSAYEAGALFFAYSLANPGTPDAIVTWEVVRSINRVETITNKTLNTPATVKPAYVQTLQLGGLKITHAFRAVGNLSIPAIDAGEDGTATFTIAGAAVGDLVIVNPTATPPTGLIVEWTWVSLADTVSVRIRNISVSNYGSGNLAVVVTVLRSAAPDA